MPWDRVHDEAEVLEHVLSDELEALIAAKLGNPTIDPHGDPIPSADLELEESPTRTLESLVPGDEGTFVRVSDADPEMLRYLARQGVLPGGHLRVLERQPFGGPLLVSVDGREHTLGGALPRAMRISVDRSTGSRRGTCMSDAVTALRPAAALEGASVALPDGVAPSALEQLLERGRLRATLAMLGPAFVAAIAYVDPGNFATNLQGGAQFGYLLLWVVLVANLMAMLIQYLSAKLGIATDRDLPELCRERFPRAVTWGLWAQAEIMAMSTDIAEFLGAALGLNLLFGVPLLPAGLMTGAIAFAILELQTRGYRRFELAVSALLGIVFLGFLYEALRIGPSAKRLAARPAPGSARHELALPGGRHHRRDRHAPRHLPALRTHKRTHGVSQRLRAPACPALREGGRHRRAGLCGTHQHGDARGLRQAVSHTSAVRARLDRLAHAQLGHLVGGGAALAFAVALFASGASSSSVGTYAGQVVMQGFIKVKIPLLARRAVTMLPAIAILAVGMNPTAALVLSQVVLSFGIPFALVPLVMLTSNRSVMGVHVNRRLTTVAAFAIAATITLLNAFLIYQQLR